MFRSGILNETETGKVLIRIVCLIYYHRVEAKTGINEHNALKASSYITRMPELHYTGEDIDEVYGVCS